MKIQDTVKKVNEAKLRSRDAASGAKIYCPTSKQLNDRFIEIRKDMGLAPRWAIAEVYGYQDALRDELYETSLVYGAVVGTEFFTCHADREDYYEKKGLTAKEFGELKKAAQGYFWSTSLKPFFAN
jgi:hypothetical protein